MADPTGNPDGQYVTNENEGEGIEVPTGAILTLLPDEQPHCKALRRVVDEVFLCRDQFMMNSARYTDTVSGEEGVNRYLRSMLFVPSRQLRRGVKRSEVFVAEADNDKALTAVKQTQRKSKQKERCENRLMSLLFATIYDPATKRCRLVQGAPPLQLRRQDKNGLYRNVSNYTDVRLFLRNSMSAILAAYTDAVKILEKLLPNVYRTVPTMFTLIGRTFMLILSCGCESVGGSGSERNVANRTLDACFDAIQEYIITWERRNFTTDNPLTNCLKAGKTNECYKAIYALLKAMIYVLPPAGIEPFSPDFRKRSIYSFGLRWGAKCHEGEEARGQCFLHGSCPSETLRDDSTGDILEASEACVKALIACAKMALTIDDYEIEKELELPYFPTAAFQSACDSAAVHRLQETLLWMRSVVSSQEGEHQRNNVGIREAVESNFIQSTQFDVARCWAALGRSNVPAARILEGLHIKEASDLTATVVELVFGGGLAAVALFEREHEIIPICGNLVGKKGQNVLAMNQGTDEMDCAMKEFDHVPGEAIEPQRDDNNNVRAEAVEPQNDDNEIEQESRVPTEDNAKQSGFEKIQSTDQARKDCEGVPQHTSRRVLVDTPQLNKNPEEEDSVERAEINEADSTPESAMVDGNGNKQHKLHNRARPEQRTPVIVPRKKKRRGTIDQTVEAAMSIQPASQRKRMRARRTRK